MTSFTCDRGRVDVHAAWTTAEILQTVERIVADWEHKLPANRDARIVVKPNLNNDLVALTGNCVDLRVLEGLFAALRRHLSDEQVLELTYITALYEMHAVMSRALRTEFDDRDDPIVEVAAPAGTSQAYDVGAATSLPRR